MRFSMLRPVLLTAAVTGWLVTASLANAATTINLSYNGPPETDKNAVHLFASNLKRLV
ncbi:hypothetical protein [Chromohalobacter sp. 296-RDG]